MPYQPLDEARDSIRVLTILSWNGEACVRCRLETVSLAYYQPKYRLSGLAPPTARRRRPHLALWKSHCFGVEHGKRSDLALGQMSDNSHCRFNWGDYATLSYAWGDLQDTRLALVNDQEVRISRNLNDALHAFETRSLFGGKLKLWVDAICINQNDVKERTSQISMMRRMYDDSWTTIAWLGKAADESREALDLLKTLAEYEIKGESEALKHKLTASPGSLGTGKWLALQKFLLRTYWSRLWVVQEVALAPDSMLMICGEDDITWKEVQEGLTSIHCVHWYIKDSCLKHDREALGLLQGSKGEELSLWDTENLHHIDKDLARIARNEARGIEPVSFRELLHIATATRSYHPLDKVYGLLAIMDPALSAQITPNYNDQPCHLFAHIARLHILQTASLGILTEGTVWNFTGTPSWAPDWNYSGHNRHRDFPQPPYMASGGLAASFTFSPCGQYLTCKAILLDNISGLGALVSSHQVGPSVAYDAATIVPTRSFNSAYGSDDATQQALNRCLVGNRSGVCAPEEISASKPRYILQLPADTDIAMEEFRQRGWTDFLSQGHRYHHWQSWRQVNGQMPLQENKLDDLFEGEVVGNENDYRLGLWDAYTRWQNVAYGRRFIVTDAGRFGWVPNNEEFGKREMEVGDRFCIVQGCDRPLVLRPGLNGTYQILGEGYLQGYMEGEALDAIRSGILVVEDITFS